MPSLHGRCAVDSITDVHAGPARVFLPLRHNKQTCPGSVVLLCGIACTYLSRVQTQLLGQEWWGS
jgi:hypothetical protein